MGMRAVALNVDHTKNKIIVDGTITLTGNYGTSGGALPHGDLLDLSHLGIESNRIGEVHAYSTVTQGSAPQYDYYHYNPGTDPSNGVLQIIVGGAEMAPAAAYASTAPTNAAGYTLWFRAEFLPFY